MSKISLEEDFCAFDLLLRSNIVHIWEKIFLSLDYESYQNCLKVSQAWNQVFHNESFQAKLRTTFSAKTWMDTENLDRSIWESKKKITFWTANSDEVAYVEGPGTESIYFIGSDGRVTSTRIPKTFKFRGENYGINRIENVWILRHVILVHYQYCRKVYYRNETLSVVGAFEKSELRYSILWTDPYHHSYFSDYSFKVTHFSPGIGVRFLIHNKQEIRLQEVPFEYQTKECIRSESVDNDHYGKIIFSEDGSHFLHFFEEGAKVYTINMNEVSGLIAKHVWKERVIDLSGALDPTVTSTLRVHSRFVMYIIKTGYWRENELHLRDIKDGKLINSYELCPSSSVLDMRQCRIDHCSLTLTRSHVFVFLSYVEESFSSSMVDGRGKVDKLVLVDLNTSQRLAKCAVRRRCIPGHINFRMKSKDIIDKTLMPFDDERIGIYNNQYTNQLFIMDLTLEDPGKIFDERKSISPNCPMGKCCQIRKGLCLLSSPQWKDYSDPGFRLKILAWKGEKLPKAFTAWSEWLTRS